MIHSRKQNKKKTFSIIFIHFQIRAFFCSNFWINTVKMQCQCFIICLCFFLLFEEIEMGVFYISGRNELDFNWRDTSELFTFWVEDICLREVIFYYQFCIRETRNIIYSRNVFYSIFVVQSNMCYWKMEQSADAINQCLLWVLSCNQIFLFEEI